jgi:hypothetical protein
VGQDISNNKGVLLHHLSGSWSVVNPPDVSSNWLLSSVHFTSTSEGWAVGYGSDFSTRRGVLLHYLYGSWTTVTPPDVSSNWDLRSVHFISSNEGWAAGSDWSNSQNYRGILLHYFNGSWAEVKLPDASPNWELNTVHFTSSNEGWAAGSGAAFAGRRGILLHYLNGSWTTVLSPDVGGDYELNSVHFTSLNEGWAVGAGGAFCDKGVLLHYLNGAWSAISPPDVSPYWELNSVYFTSSDEGWAVGIDHVNSCLILAPPPPPKGVILNFSRSSVPLTGSLENPSNGQKVSGIAAISGWALDGGAGITNIELFIDGQLIGNIAYGNTRKDVKEAYPDYPNAENSGFAMIWNYSSLTSGNHTVKVRLHNQEEETKDLDASVVVVKFHGDFVEDMIPNSRWLRLNRVKADGITKTYDIKIQWSNETQAFEITDIVPRFRNK